MAPLGNVLVRRRARRGPRRTPALVGILGLLTLIAISSCGVERPAAGPTGDAPARDDGAVSPPVDAEQPESRRGPAEPEPGPIAVPVQLSARRFVEAEKAEGPVAIPTRGLLAWYPFSGSADDVTGNGNRGRPSRARPTEDRFGEAKSAYAFMGNSVVLLSDLPKPARALAVSVWVKYATTDTPHDWSNTIFAWGGDGPEENYFALDTHKLGAGPEGGLLCFAWDHHWHDGRNEGGGSCLSDDLIVEDVWYHVVAIYEDRGSKAARRLRLYVDGEIQDSIRGNMPQLGRRAAIGGSGKREPRWGFHGAIDDVRIYNRALTAREIRALFRESGFVKPETRQPPGAEYTF